MKRILISLMLLVLLAACGTPNQVPVPVTQGPTAVPPTAAAKINAPVVDSPGMVNIQMVDEKNGWGITDTQVVRTEDGGVTWYDVSMPQAPTLGYSAKGDFIDAMHGWVVVSNSQDPTTGALYRTEDGGATWKNFSTPFGYSDIKFLDANNGWVLATISAGAGSDAVAVFQTTDGGATWNKMFNNDPQAADSNDTLPLSGIKDGITPLDANNAWIGGVVYTPGVVYLYRTSDAGKTWALSPVTVPAGYEQAEFETVGPQFVSKLDAYLPVHVTTQNGVMIAVYVSHDGGANWAFTPTMIPNGGTMDFVSLTDGFVWNAASFYVTHDGAKTWTNVTPDVAFGDTFAGMDFVSPTTGFVLTGDANNVRHLYKTTDSGASWTKLGK